MLSLTGIQDWLFWVVAQGLSWGCSQDIDGDFGRSSAYVTGAGVPTSKRLIHGLLDEGFTSSPCGPLLTKCQQISSRASDTREAESQVLSWPSAGSDIASYLSYSVDHTYWIWYSLGGGYTRVWIPGSRDHRGQLGNWYHTNHSGLPWTTGFLIYCNS